MLSASVRQSTEINGMVQIWIVIEAAEVWEENPLGGNRKWNCGVCFSYLFYSKFPTSSIPNFYSLWLLQGHTSFPGSWAGGGATLWQHFSAASLFTPIKQKNMGYYREQWWKYFAMLQNCISFFKRNHWVTLQKWLVMHPVHGAHRY